MGKTVEYEKVCDCHPATASGPRIITPRVEMMLDHIQFTAHMVALACDECDTPWSRTHPTDSEGDE